MKQHVCFYAQAYVVYLLALSHLKHTPPLLVNVAFKYHKHGDVLQERSVRALRLAHAHSALQVRL